MKPLIAWGILGLLLISDVGFAQTSCVEVLGSGQLSRSDISARVDELARLRLEYIEVSDSSSKSTLAKTIERDFLERLHELETIVGAKETRRLLREAIQEEQEQSIAAREEDKKTKKESREGEAKILAESIPGDHIILNRIEPGKFKMGTGKDEVPVTITKAFDMMSTLTTQVIWRKVAELSKQKFPKKFKPEASPSGFTGDRLPVENVSWDLVQRWIQALNSLSRKGVPELEDIIPDHQKGDIYRLPTEAEWEFVVRGRGMLNEDYFFGKSPSALNRFAWFNQNSGYKTHEVGQKDPLEFEGLRFFDMLGNVGEWVTDEFDSGKLPGGKDPVGKTRNKILLGRRVTKGGDYSSTLDLVRSSSRSSWPANKGNYYIGFRLVREAR